MIAYQVTYNDSYDQIDLGTYVDLQIAQTIKTQAQESIYDETLRNCVAIQEVKILTSLPIIYTHSACISFANIKEVLIEKLDMISIYQYPEILQISKSGRPTVCVTCLGTSSEDAEKEVKKRLDNALKNGIFDHYQQFNK